MHEMTLMENVLDVVLSEVEGKDVARVTEVHMTIGELMDVIDELVEPLFQFLARGTLAEDAKIVINHVDAYVQCHGCQEAWHIDVRDESTWTCPRCGAYKNYRLVSGREFTIDYLGVEAAPEADERMAG